MNKKCPNIHCQFHLKSTSIVKDGKFKRKDDSKMIQRYRCKFCKTRFSNSTFSITKNQKKRRINYQVYKLLSSSVSIRRTAKILNISKDTVKSRLEFLSFKAQRNQEKLLLSLKKTVTHMQFDDLVTIEHTKLKPVSVSIAVDVDSRMILGAYATQIPAFGHLAQISKAKYGHRKSHHKEGLEILFQKITPVIHPNALVESDEHNFYPEFVRKYLPEAEHLRYKGGRGCVVGQGELKKLKYDPLFAINHTCAMLRANINRLVRKTWCTTKKIEMLQKHLDLYIYYHNNEILSG